LETLKDWSLAHGLTVRPPLSLINENQEAAGIFATTAPVTLFPSLFPRACFDEAVAIQSIYNELYAAIASDEEWLEEIVRE
jgi:glutathione synthase